MNTDFKDVMSKRTDDELIQIVTIDKNKYQPLAIEAAEEEIKKRNIDTTKIEQVKVDLTIKITEQEEFEANKVSSSTRFINFIIDTIVWFIIVAILTNPINTKSPIQMLLGYFLFIFVILGIMCLWKQNIKRQLESL